MAGKPTPRPTGGNARSRGAQPPGARAAKSTPGATSRRQPGGKQDLVAKAQAEQHRLRMQEQQRRAAARADDQQRLRQQLALREAHNRQREQEAVRRTAEVQDRVAGLESILSTGLARSSRIDLDALLRPRELPGFDPGELARPAPQPAWEAFAPSNGPLAGLWGGQARRQRREAAAREAYERAKASWERAERERERRLAEARRVHEARVAREREEMERYHARVTRIATGLRDRDPKAVESYLRTVLRRVPLPSGFPRGGEVSHDPEREWVVVRVGVPKRDVVPDVVAYEYLEPTDELRPLPRSQADAADLYRRVLAQVALLTVRDVLAAEPRLSGVTCHGHVPVSGESEDRVDQPRLIALSADRDTFERLDLLEMPALEALLKLDATVSPDPYAYVPVSTL